MCIVVAPGPFRHLETRLPVTVLTSRAKRVHDLRFTFTFDFYTEKRKASADLFYIVIFFFFFFYFIQDTVSSIEKRPGRKKHLSGLLEIYDFYE